VDNFGDSVGLVVDWRALARRWQPDPLAARGGCGCVDNQPGDWTASGLRKSSPQRRKGAKENLSKRVEGFSLRLCVFAGEIHSAVTM
jgi:hypothetical protein